MCILEQNSSDTKAQMMCFDELQAVDHYTGTHKRTISCFLPRVPEVNDIRGQAKMSPSARQQGSVLSTPMHCLSQVFIVMTNQNKTDIKVQ